MLSGRLKRKGRADRASARSAVSQHSWPVNISIRATIGDCSVLKQGSSDSAIDNSVNRDILYAIDWPAIISMSEIEIVAQIESHRKKCAGDLEWFAGVRVAPRIHPWDEQELPFSTSAWIDLLSDTPEEAQRVARSLFALGWGRSPAHAYLSSGKHVFAYAVKKIASLN